MKPVEPILTVELFPDLSAELLSALRSCSGADWDKPTACPSWSVKDVAAHLLGGNIGRLWLGRDKLLRQKPSAASMSYGELLEHINQQNAEWVRAAKRISPTLLIDFLQLTDK